ncbi:NADH-quinone oxidoreductase subunit NuoB [Methanomethylovorans sp.]|uniref:NADH-quinone oxidoreductase subunit NuoB n=1 Tax=Methanomethylovorans sp. TaxID=2758717 RepID=UPI00351C8F32
MLRIFKKTIQTRVVTTGYPQEQDIAPVGFRGEPNIDPDRCTFCGDCVDICPAGVIQLTGEKESDENILTLACDGCIFCGRCEEVCTNGAIKLTQEYELASKTRENLLLQVGGKQKVDEETEIMGQRLHSKIKNIFGRSLSIREVHAGSCNGCEVEVNALTNPIYDIERFGMHIVASPRHADMLLVTGPVSRNMELALLKTYEATPEPKLVAAMGSCACNGGIFGNTYASGGGVDKFLPVDVYIAGCPPRPQAVIFGIMMAIDKLEEKTKKK